MIKVPGVRFDFGGGNVYVLAPLTLGALRVLLDGIKDVKTGLTITEQETISAVLLSSLQRNYPEMTAEKLESFVDVGNMLAAFNACLDVAGLKRKTQEAEDAKSQTQS